MVDANTSVSIASIALSVAVMMDIFLVKMDPIATVCK